MRLGNYMYPWLIINSAARQDPLNGFATLTEWLHFDISRNTRMIQRWFIPCSIIVLGLVVMAFAAMFFLLISRLGSVYG